MVGNRAALARGAATVEMGVAVDGELAQVLLLMDLGKVLTICWRLIRILV